MKMKHENYFWTGGDDFNSLHEEHGDHDHVIDEDDDQFDENIHDIYYYEVCFKCSSDIYKTREKQQTGDMVTVYCDRGFTIGFVSKEIFHDELQLKLSSNPNFNPKRIHSFLKDEDKSIQKTLFEKVNVEKFALSQCKILMRGHRLGVLAEAIATEFQFDNKRLTIYLNKQEEVSVCRLVRKLYEKFKTRIKVLEVDKPQLLRENAAKYLKLSKLDIELDEIFQTKNEKPAPPFLLTKYQQLNGINSIDSPNSFSKGSLCDISQEYLQYGPSTQQRNMCFANLATHSASLPSTHPPAFASASTAHGPVLAPVHDHSPTPVFMTGNYNQTSHSMRDSSSCSSSSIYERQYRPSMMANGANETSLHMNSLPVTYNFNSNPHPNSHPILSRNNNSMSVSPAAYGVPPSPHMAPQMNSQLTQQQMVPVMNPLDGYIASFDSADGAIESNSNSLSPLDNLKFPPAGESSPYPHSLLDFK